MPRGNPDKLIPTNKRTKKEASELGRKGGIRSGEVRREKKLLSKMYGDFLAKKYKVKKDGKLVEVEGTEVVGEIIKDILMRRDSSSVSMLREIREATEGQNIKLTDEDGNPPTFNVCFVTSKK